MGYLDGDVVVSPSTIPSNEIMKAGAPYGAIESGFHLLSRYKNHIKIDPLACRFCLDRDYACLLRLNFK